ncbi:MULTISPECIES: AraC family transcriptional regulator [Flectobacillus]|uniref:AraC family transcriptional regulator n=1 Tax=Flectobacillus roseus TaxID=502259 RepID=A0ABT6YC58_9BACT|nr:MULTISPECIES: AraC family transcriptional regulator [Flectobacillus]MDI9861151.1 AraC family transcriptional regulator [Flectobacillus roseus]MDI9870748.1 AraC family transcriptional regulator [Flectobacillus roseus]NBA78008.1 helix-turn-helix domain-containing protein [Emticicia sp. ODNR4P]PAC28886.1 AraC family transcriptional regulator [Flectobacillus sp. BAB-3569]
MKPLFQKVPVKLESSFSVRHDVRPNFGGIWHYHPELELHYIIRGEGVRFIGDNISNFSHGEIVLVGENLPHTWRCKEEYFYPDNDLDVEAVVIQFLPDCLGKYLLGLPEAYLLPKLYEKAKSGMVIIGETRERLTELMIKIAQAKNLERISLLISILHLLAESDEFETIAGGQAFYQSNESDTLRLNKVCNYTLMNYKKDITLEEIAAISNLSVTSFCRYFKLMTKKTYYDFLIEIRISHACRALVEDKLPTEVICFDCGFNNVSNFYRHFKKVMGITPLEYKRKYHKK